MLRKARIDAPVAMYHVIVKEIERGNIFRSDDDWVTERVAEVISMGMIR